jgi:hypothetical protein
MENIRTANAPRKSAQKLEAIAWAAIFIWWGLTELVQSLTPGIGAIGLGIILLGLNAARSRNSLPVSGFTITLGILALVWGGLDFAAAVLRLSFELPVFAILLIVLGLIVLGRELVQNQNV